jgi:hypothetical protein
VAKEQTPKEELDESARLKRFQLLFDEAVKNRKDTTDEWNKNLKILHADDQDTSSVSQGVTRTKKANTKVNFLHSQHETFKAIIPGSLPQVVLEPVLETPAWNMIAREFEKQIARVHSRNDIRARVVEIVDNGLKRGKAYLKQTWDKDMTSGFGGIKLEVPNTKSVYLEPGIMELRDMNYLFQVTSVNQLTLLRRYPEKRPEILALFRGAEAGPSSPVAAGTSSLDSASEESIETNPSAPGAASNTTSAGIFDLGSMEMEEGEDKKRAVDVVEMWFKDDTLEDGIIKVLSRGKMVERKGKVKKFPNGKVVTFVAGSKLMLDERKNEFPGFPYSEYLNYRDSDKQYQIDELKNAVPIQNQYDMRNNQLHDLANFNLAPIRYFGAGSGVDTARMVNMPALMVECNDVTQIKTENAPGIPAELFASLDKIRREMEIVQGVEEINRGAVPGDIRSGAGIEALQESVDTRLKSKSGEVESMMKDSAGKLISMFQKHYIEGVHFVMLGEVEDEDGMPVDIKQTEEWKFWKEKAIDSTFFDIKVQAGVNRPRSRVAKQQFIQWMYGADSAGAGIGIVDDEYVITHSDVEGKEELMKRMKPIWDKKREIVLQNIEQAGAPEDASNTV